jgi:hypothetical protein
MSRSKETVPRTTSSCSGSPDPTTRARGLLALAVVLGLLGTVAPSAGAIAPRPAAGAAASVTLVYSSSAQLGVTVALTDTNGSALRYAIDGNFVPFVNSLPLNASMRSSILGTINSSEQNPFLAGFFGNRDGHVDAGEVSQFESLLLNGAKLVPSSTFLNPTFVHLTLDGAAPTSSTLGGFGFPGAVGADSSSAPVEIDIDLTDGFSGATAPTNASHGSSTGGNPHTIGLGWSTPAGFGLLLNPTVDFSAKVPSATSIVSTTGLTGERVANDPWGWGPSSASGSFTPATSGNVTVAFHDAFPVGDLVIALGIALPLVAVGVLLLRRRSRRRREKATASSA